MLWERHLLSQSHNAILCRTPLHEECMKHHGHKGDLGVTPGTCGAIGGRAPAIKNASHPRRLGVTRVRP